MLPFGGQGSNQAIEDGGALGFLLRDVKEVGEIPLRLSLFDKVRRKRASRVQILSKTRVGREREVQEELKSYAEFDESGEHFAQFGGFSHLFLCIDAVLTVPSTFTERIAHDFGSVATSLQTHVVQNAVADTVEASM